MLDRAAGRNDPAAGVSGAVRLAWGLPLAPVRSGDAMNEVMPVLEQFRQLLAQHVDPQSLTRVVPAALVCLLLGVALSVFGAKLARAGVTLAFGLLGAGIGWRLGLELGAPPALPAMISGLVVGTIGFVTFRMWAGLFAGLVLASLALGVFGYQRALPHVLAYQPESQPAQANFSVPSPTEQAAYRDRDPRQFVEGLRTFVAGRDAHVERDGRWIAIGTLLLGTMLGVLACRTMSILATSIAGTFLVSSASATLLAQFIPGAYPALLGHPVVAGVGMGAFLVGSLFMQIMLTRKPRPAAES